MGEVMVIMKVSPDEPGTEDTIMERLKMIKSGKIAEIKKEPLAFGLYLIIIGIILENKQEGEMTALEEEIKAIQGVSGIQITGTTLL